jgi:hypothetical protein
VGQRHAGSDRLESAVACNPGALLVREVEEMLSELDQRRMHEHVRTAGWLLIAVELVGITCGGLGFFFMFSIGLVSGDAEAIPILGMMGGFMLCMMFIMSVPGLVAGFGLLRRKSWARILALIVAFFNMAWFPLGTAVGLYLFWVLMQNEAPAYFYEYDDTYRPEDSTDAEAHK